MRLTLSIALLLICGLAQSQDITNTQVTKQQKTSGTKQTESGLPSVTIKVVQPPKTEDEKAEEKKERDSKAVADDRLIDFTGQLASYTLWLFVATLLLAVGTLGLGWFAWRQSRDTKRSADAAFVSSMPILSPYVVPEHTILHPFFKTPKFRAKVSFVFENFGKTPAMIREVKADLFLCEQDAFPEVNFDELPPIGYEPIVSGDSRGKQAMMGVAEFNKDFELSDEAYGELLKEAKEKFRRMALIGRVVYDDFFGMRHTRNFCVKLRSMPRDDGGASLFQLVRGRDPYNRVTREETPKN